MHYYFYVIFFLFRFWFFLVRQGKRFMLDIAPFPLGTQGKMFGLMLGFGIRPVVKNVTMLWTNTMFCRQKRPYVPYCRR